MYTNSAPPRASRRILSRPRQYLMTREEFQAWLDRGPRRDLYIAPPYDLVRCECGDINCHGWKFVAVRRRR